MDSKRGLHHGVFVAAAVLVLWLLGALLLSASLAENGARPVYLIDDTYIHMAMARNMAEHGVWGVTRRGFSSSSSAPLWTGCIALAYAVFGVGEWPPLLLALVCVSGMLITLLFYFRTRHGLGGPGLFLLSLAWIGLVPLPYLVFSGLEHGLQIWLDLLFVLTLVGLLDGGEAGARHRVWLVVLASLVVLVRYEGLFLVAAAVLVLLFRREVRTAVFTALAALAPVVAYGVFSLAKGWYFLPNSVLLKGNRPALTGLSGALDFLVHGLRQLVYNVHLLVLVLLVVALLTLYRGRGEDRRAGPVFLGWIFVLTTVMHMFFARSGFFLNYYYQVRYDAYLTGLGLLAATALLLGRPRVEAEKRPLTRGVLVLILSVVLLPLVERGLRTTLKIVPATHATFSHQVQLGDFLARHYEGRSVALNDIGGANFFADIRCLDILGLGSREVADLILRNRYDRGALAGLARREGVEIAVINADLLEDAGGVPPSWREVARWRLLKNVVSSEDVVSFYAVAPGSEGRLREALASFARLLPEGVAVEWPAAAPERGST